MKDLGIGDNVVFKDRQDDPFDFYRYQPVYTVIMFDRINGNKYVEIRDENGYTNWVRTFLLEEYVSPEVQREISERERQYALSTIKDILKGHDIRMGVGGCGCCGSPWVSFEYKGEKIVDNEDDFNFDMFEDDDS